MPTYTYVCTKCGEEIEVFQSMSDPPLKRCKVCRGALRRTFHPVGIVLKGSGFYKTDNRSSGRSTPRSEESTSSSDKPEKPKTDTKSASSSSSSEGGTTSSEASSSD